MARGPVRGPAQGAGARRHLLLGSAAALALSAARECAPPRPPGAGPRSRGAARGALGGKGWRPQPVGGDSGAGGGPIRSRQCLAKFCRVPRRGPGALPPATGRPRPNPPAYT